LLDFAATQEFVVTVRQAIVCADLGTVDSRRINAVSEALEEFLAALECTLTSMSPPRSELVDPTATEHSVHGLFKIRSLLEVHSNKFQTFESRRFWNYLVGQGNLHRLIEHHVFERSRRVGASVSELVESTVVYSTGRNDDIYCVCVNPNRPTQLVIGTAKGLVELTCDAAPNGGHSSFPQIYDNNSPPLLSPLGSGSGSGTGTPLNRSRPRTPEVDGSWTGSRESSSAPSPILFGGGGGGGGGAAGSMAAENNKADAVFKPTLHRSTNGSVRAIAQHPVMPCYVSGTSNGELDLWHYDQQHSLSKFRSYAQSKTKITSVHFSDLGNKFGATMSSGDLALWRFLAQDESDEPFLSFRAHSRRTNDFTFAGATSLVVTGGVGSGSDGGNVALWDTLLMSTDRSCQAYPVRFFNVNDSGTLSLAYSKASQRIFCGGSKGELTVVDLRQQKVVKTWMAHEGGVNKLVIDEKHGTLVTASGSGAVKLWALNNLRQIANFDGVHARSSFSVSGVVGMDLAGDSLYTSGLDGSVKLTHPWLLFGGSTI
jgi:WD40 repeat protein